MADQPATPEVQVPRDVLLLAAFMHHELVEAIPTGDTADVLQQAESLAPALVLGAAAIEVVGDGDIAPQLGAGDWMKLAKDALERLFRDETLQKEVLKRLKDAEPDDETVYEGVDIALLRRLRRDASEDGVIGLDKLPESQTFLIEYAKDSPGQEAPDIVREMIVRPARIDEKTWLQVIRDRSPAMFNRKKQERFMGSLIRVGTIINTANTVRPELRVGSMLVVITPGPSLDGSYGKRFENDEQFLHQVYLGSDRRFPLFPELDLT